MSTLIVGGDHVNAYKDFILSQGLGPVLHWNGRKNSECHRIIPARTRLLVILVDQVNHRLALKMRRVAGDMDLPVIFSRRSMAQLDQAIARYKVGAEASLQ